MTNKEGILGVLGGMGPQATNTFYQRIIDRTQAESDQEHLRVLIWSDAKIPDRTAGILGGREEEVFQHLLAGAKLLETAGCTHLAIPCNTSHYFADRLQDQLHIPIIHMIRETVKTIQAAGKKTVGILATDGTVRTGIYQKGGNTSHNRINACQCRTVNSLNSSQNKQPPCHQRTCASRRNENISFSVFHHIDATDNGRVLLGPHCTHRCFFIADDFSCIRYRDLRSAIV